MNVRIARILLTLSLFLGLARPAAAQQNVTAPVVYTVIDLGTLAHPDQDACYGVQPGATVHDVGVGNRAVGSIYQEEERGVATLFSAAGPRKMVSGEGGGVAHAINGTGILVGSVYESLPSEACGSPSGSLPAMWNDAFEIEMLELPDGVSAGAALTVNQSGTIAGWVETDRGQRAAIWSDGEVSIIEHPEIDGVASFESEAVGINDDGVAAGTVRWQAAGEERSAAFVWDGQNANFLDPQLGENAWATSINNSGVVAGAVVTEDGLIQPALWWRGQIVSLDPLPDRPNAIATDVNNAGFAVGYGAREDGLTRAMIWISGAAFDLNDIVSQDVGWQLQMAVGINDDGVIAGWGDLDGERRAVLLVPAAG